MKKITLFTILSLLLMFAVVSAQHGDMKFGDNDPHGNVFIDKCGPQGDGHGMKAGKHKGRHFQHKGRKGKCGMGCRGQKGHGGMGLERLIKMADRLELSDSQVADLKKMSVDFQMEKVDMMASIKKAQIRLKALHHDEASEREVFRAIDDLAGLKADMQKMKYSHKNAAKDILTEEQLEKLKEGRHREIIIEKEFYFDSDEDGEHDGENIEKKIIKHRG